MIIIIGIVVKAVSLLRYLLKHFTRVILLGNTTVVCIFIYLIGSPTIVSLKHKFTPTITILHGKTKLQQSNLIILLRLIKNVQLHKTNIYLNIAM